MHIGGVMDWGLSILMHPEDEIGVLTKHGKFFGICAQDEQYVRLNADRIHEAMIAVMKVPAHREGIWVWKISHGWTQMRGERIELQGEQQCNS